MKLKVCINPENEQKTAQSSEKIEEEVKRAAELWTAGKQKDAAAILIHIFQSHEDPAAWYFTPYIEKLGKEYCDLIAKMYILQLGSGEEEDGLECFNLQEFLEECPNNTRIKMLIAEITGDQWNNVQEKFYDKCPECMFMGDADEPYSLKLRSPHIVECIPEGADLHELSGMEYMDGYNMYEGFALVKDDPNAEENYPEKIQAVLKKIKDRGRKHFPYLIFPLTEGKNILDTCAQMQELLELLDYGYHFENISSYISNHPKLFKDRMKKRMRLLQALAEDEDDEDSENDDDEINMDDLDILFEDDKEEETGSSDKKRSGGRKRSGQGRRK